MNDISSIKSELVDAVFMMEIRRAAISAIAHGGSVVASEGQSFKVDCGKADIDMVSRRIGGSVANAAVEKISDRILSVRQRSRW